MTGSGVGSFTGRGLGLGATFFLAGFALEALIATLIASASCFSACLIAFLASEAAFFF